MFNSIAEHDGLKQDGTPDKRVGTGGELINQDAYRALLKFHQNLPRVKSTLTRLAPRAERALATLAILMMILTTRALEILEAVARAVGYIPLFN